MLIISTVTGRFIGSTASIGLYVKANERLRTVRLQHDTVLGKICRWATHKTDPNMEAYRYRFVGLLIHYK
jgi:hypothetical protein